VVSGSQGAAGREFGENRRCGGTSIQALAEQGAIVSCPGGIHKCRVTGRNQLRIPINRMI